MKLSLKALADNRQKNSVATRLRRKRFELFQQLLTSVPQRPVRILDIGGAQEFWELMGLPDSLEIEVTLLNLVKMPVTRPNFASTVGDARDMSQFSDHAFDVAFSNSVIEHVGRFADQQAMAAEVRRVGRRYFLQTPNKYFPIEPHFLFPGFQFLPIPVRAWLLAHFDLGWWKKAADYGAAKKEVEQIRLLTRPELEQLFPEATFYREKFLGLVKSFVVYRS